FKTGSSDEPTHEFAPHRSATQMLSPSLSVPTPLVDPQVRPAGIFAHPTMVSYGLGSLLVGSPCETACAVAGVVQTPTNRRATRRLILVIRTTLPPRSPHGNRHYAAGRASLGDGVGEGRGCSSVRAPGFP